MTFCQDMTVKTVKTFNEALRTRTCGIFFLSDSSGRNEDGCVFVFAGLQPFRPTRATTGQWDVGYGGGSDPGINGRSPDELIPVWPQ